MRGASAYASCVNVVGGLRLLLEGRLIEVDRHSYVCLRWIVIFANL